LALGGVAQGQEQVVPLWPRDGEVVDERPSVGWEVVGAVPAGCRVLVEDLHLGRGKSVRFVGQGGQMQVSWAERGRTYRWEVVAWFGDSQRGTREVRRVMGTFRVATLEEVRARYRRSEPHPKRQRELREAAHRDHGGGVRRGLAGALRGGAARADGGSAGRYVEERDVCYASDVAPTASAEGEESSLEEASYRGPGLPLPVRRTLSEARSMPSSGPIDWGRYQVSDEVVKAALARIAARFGKTVRVTSGDRHHVPRGGSPASWHLRGRAADFRVEGISDEEVFRVLRDERGALLTEGTFEVIWHKPGTNTGGPHLHLANRAPRTTVFKVERGGRYERVR
jgi:hypothetical protein